MIEPMMQTESLKKPAAKSLLNEKRMIAGHSPQKRGSLSAQINEQKQSTSIRSRLWGRKGSTYQSC
jgi:hypothetical protein